MVQALVHLSDEIVALLDEVAAAEGLSRSAVIHQAIVNHLTQMQRASIGHKIFEGYQRIPQSDTDEWGDLGRFSDRAAIEGLARLDHEEQEAGHPPW